MASVFVETQFFAGELRWNKASQRAPFEMEV
jgi:hypothetical protein